MKSTNVISEHNYSGIRNALYVTHWLGKTSSIQFLQDLIISLRHGQFFSIHFSGFMLQSLSLFQSYNLINNVLSKYSPTTSKNKPGDSLILTYFVKLS